MTSHGEIVVDDNGALRSAGVPRKNLPPLPDFHALSHTAAMATAAGRSLRAQLPGKPLARTSNSAARA